VVKDCVTFGVDARPVDVKSIIETMAGLPRRIIKVQKLSTTQNQI
jgi:hypothetical protein